MDRAKNAIKTYLLEPLKDLCLYVFNIIKLPFVLVLFLLRCLGAIIEDITGLEVSEWCEIIFIDLKIIWLSLAGLIFVMYMCYLNGIVMPKAAYSVLSFLDLM